MGVLDCPKNQIALASFRQNH